MLYFAYKICIKEANNMRTTIDIPDELMKDALRVSQAKTKTMVIVLGLQELINRHKLRELGAMEGKLHLDVDLRKSRKR